MVRLSPRSLGSVLISCSALGQTTSPPVSLDIQFIIRWPVRNTEYRIRSAAALCELPGPFSASPPGRQRSFQGSRLQPWRSVSLPIPPVRHRGYGIRPIDHKAPSHPFMQCWLGWCIPLWHARPPPARRAHMYCAVQYSMQNT